MLEWLVFQSFVGAKVNLSKTCCNFLNIGLNFEYYGALGVTAEKILWNWFAWATLVKLNVSVIDFQEFFRSPVEFIKRLLQFSNPRINFEYYKTLGVTAEEFHWNCFALATLFILKVSVIGFLAYRWCPGEFIKNLLKFCTLGQVFSPTVLWELLQKKCPESLFYQRP